MTRFIRCCMTVLIVISGVALGLMIGPHPPAVHAEFYIDLMKALELPAFKRGVVKDSEIRRFRFNGEDVFYSIHETTEPIVDVFKFQLDHLHSRQKDKATSLMKSYGDVHLTPEQEESAEYWAPIFTRLLDDNVYTETTEDWGYLFALTKNLGEKDPLSDLARRWKSFLGNGNLGELGTANIILAYRDDAAGSTQYLQFWTAPDFNLYHVVPQHGKEPPGREMPDVPRLPGTTRVVSIEELSEDLAGVTNAYTVNGSIAVLSQQMIQQLSETGWRQIAPRDLTNRNDDRAVLYFEKVESSLTVSFLRTVEGTLCTVARKL